jgi:hypothetical protein
MGEEFVRTQRIGYGEDREIWTSKHRGIGRANQIYVHHGGARKTNRMIGNPVFTAEDAEVFSEIPKRSEGNPIATLHFKSEFSPRGNKLVIGNSFFTSEDAETRRKKTGVNNNAFVCSRPKAYNARGDRMPQSSHQRVAEFHNLAAHAHNAAAVAHGKGEHLTAHELSRQAHEHSMNAHKLSEELAGQHADSGKKP